MAMIHILPIAWSRIQNLLVQGTFTFYILVSVSCSTPPAKFTYSPIDISRLSAASSSTPMRARDLGNKGVEYLLSGKLDDASSVFNEALELDPSSAGLHLLNAMTYHLKNRQAGGEAYQLAIEGYQLALRFDPSAWLAHLQLGTLLLESGYYNFAQNHLSKAWLMQPNNPQVLTPLIVASYYARDPVTAYAASSKLRTLDANSDLKFGNVAIVLAALGENDKAQLALDRFRENGFNPDRAKYIAERLKNWNQVHAEVQGQADNPHTAEGRTKNVSNNLRQLSPNSMDDQDKIVNRIPSDGMVAIDVVLLEVEEESDAEKGVNLLDGLSIQFGSSFSKNESKTKNHNRFSSTNSFNSFNSTNSSSSSSFFDTASRTFSYGLSVPQVTYSLNIFNATDARSHIIAQPTLVARNGETSEFFSGIHINAASTSSSATTFGVGIGGQAVSIEKEIGITLNITPRIINENRIALDVYASRTSLQQPSSAIDFDFRLQTSRTYVKASLEMSIGETLLLSGLSEQQTRLTRDGVPLLQDIPIIQYFFSNEVEVEFQKSQLILITPRLPMFAYSDVPGRRVFGKHLNRPYSDQLFSRFKKWFRSSENWESILSHLEETDNYQSFRSGDVKFEEWDNTNSLKNRLLQALKFLYF